MIDGAGPGSELDAVKPLIEWLPKIASRHRIKIVNDAGCGRQAWIKHVKWSVNYKGYDREQYNPDIEVIDILTEKMRPADLIICKDVFRHLSEDEMRQAIKLFRTKYLLCDTEPGAPICGRRECPRDMQRYLHKPLATVQSNEDSGARHLDWWKGKFWGLWRLSDAP